jgi:hypothetical protein
MVRKNYRPQTKAPRAMRRDRSWLKYSGAGLQRRLLDSGCRKPPIRHVDGIEKNMVSGIINALTALDKTSFNAASEAVRFVANGQYTQKLSGS